ncbi:MAG TPA: ABC transporter ATP-binding protein [Acetobacteraceae bacterium]|nr:ABC transporter ATP-binding protein [Acetobacteraceae bacterium]
MMAPLLEARGVTLQYKTRRHLVTATYRVDLAVHEGDRFIILGPSGCGKSTLLKAIGGFMLPVEGSISLSGRPVTAPGPDRMMVFQEFEQLMPWKTVLGNVMFPMRAARAFPRQQIRDRAMAALAKVHLAQFAEVHPHMLSGGMKMRVAIARALAMEPAILLMDEPFAALDAMTRRHMQQELYELWQSLRFTMLFVTHSIEEAVLLGSRILLLSAHPGQVRAELNAAHLDGRDASDPEVGRLTRRIHDLLFGAAAPVERETVNV